MLPLQGAWVLFLVVELGSRKPRSAAKKFFLITLTLTCVTRAVVCGGGTLKSTGLEEGSQMGREHGSPGKR